MKRKDSIKIKEVELLMAQVPQQHHHEVLRSI
jgi:hypothetical protein